jgi:hypothetical protein
MPISNLYSEYASVKAQIAALELKEEQLRPHIIEMMQNEGEDKKDIGVGKFSLSSRKVWTYPERITEMNEELKAEKAKAESTGEATFEEVPQLRYTAAKL